MDFIRNLGWNSNSNTEGEAIQLKAGTSSNDFSPNNDSCLNKLRNFLLLCDQNQCFMTLLQYPKIENILELIIFSDKINDAINDLLSGKKSLFLENITNFNPNFEKTNNYKIEKIENNEISPIKTYEDGVKRLEKILNKYKSLMVNDEKEINNIIKFFKNYK